MRQHNLRVTGSLSINGENVISASELSALSSSIVSRIEGLNPSQIGTGSYTASISSTGGFNINTTTTITGSLLVSNLSGSGVNYISAVSGGLLVAVSGSNAILNTQRFIATAGQTVFNSSYGYLTGLVQVYYNGTKLDSTEFSDINGSTITLTTGSNQTGDIVELVTYRPVSGVEQNALRTKTSFTASVSQTTFAVQYTPGLIDVYFNGSHLASEEYTANNGTTIVLTEAATGGEVVDVFVYNNQIGAFSGIGGGGEAGQFAYFSSQSGISGSSVISISGSNIIAGGSIIPSISGSYDLGSSTKPFRHIYVGTGSIYLVDNTGQVTNTISAQTIVTTDTLASGTIDLTDSLPAGTVSSSTQVVGILSALNQFTASNDNTSLNSKTGSYATTGSNTFFGTQTFSGSVYIANDLIVQGSSSIQYITGSSVNIGTNIVQLNTANPSIRFAGLTMIDSGSIGGSGSFLYDSVQDEFIFVHRGNNTNVTSSHFVLGPETYDNLGNESYLTCNRLTKGTGKEHLVDSSIFDDGTTVCVNANLKGNGQVCSLMGNFSCIGVGTITPVSKLTVYDSTDVEIRLQTVNTGTTSVDGFNIGLQNSSCDVYLNQRENANLFLNTSGSIRLSINGGGCVGIGTQSPTLALSVIGQVRAGYATGAGLTIGLSPIGVPNNDLNAYVIWGDAASFGDNNGDLIYIPRSSTTAHHRFYTANVGLATEKMRITYDGKLGINTITPCTILHAVIQTCYGANGTVANSHPVATFSQCDCGAGARGLQIGVPTGGVNSPVFLKISNTGVRFAILDQSNCENFTISGVNVGIVCTSPGVSLVIGGTDALKLPTGTTAQRPTGAAGLVRMNTTTGQPEWYNTTTSTWASFNQNVNNYLVEYLVVGGGGGGGYDNGAGGGAGGFVLDCGLSVSSCASYSVIVGAGGSATTGVSGFGGASCFNGVVALGGGGGGGQTNIGGDGGSGGGSMYYPIGAIRGGFGTIGQGFEGGCWTTLSSPWIGAGGGGASQRGFDGPFNGMGGAGKPSTLLGNTCYYAGGGNGSGDSPGCQTQPLGGGGIAGNPTGGNGSTNSGGGGGGGINGGNFGGNGGSGVVIIRYPGCQRGSGGTICSYCGTTIHVFTSSGTFIA